MHYVNDINLVLLYKWIYLVKLFYKKVTCLFIVKYIHFMICDRITHIQREFHRKKKKKINLGGCLCKKNNHTPMTDVRFYQSLGKEIYFLVHLDKTKSPCELLPSLGVRRPSSVVCCLSSVNFSHFKLLLRNHWADWNQTQQECSLDGPLQSYCFSFQSDIQYGCQGQ